MAKIKLDKRCKSFGKTRKPKGDYSLKADVLRSIMPFADDSSKLREEIQTLKRQNWKLEMRNTEFDSEIHNYGGVVQDIKRTLDFENELWQGLNGNGPALLALKRVREKISNLYKRHTWASEIEWEDL